MKQLRNLSIFFPSGKRFYQTISKLPIWKKMTHLDRMTEMVNNDSPNTPEECFYKALGHKKVDAYGDAIRYALETVKEKSPYQYLGYKLLASTYKEIENNVKALDYSKMATELKERYSKSEKQPDMLFELPEEDAVNSEKQNENKNNEKKYYEEQEEKVYSSSNFNVQLN